MGTVRRYLSHIAATDAAEALRSAGIVATVVSDMDAIGGLKPSGPGQHAVVIQDPADHDRAIAFLASLDQSPITGEPGWEDAAATPDLSLLPTPLQIPCPSCSAPLPRDATITACPKCAVPVNPAEIVVKLHGPEALARCYPDPDTLSDRTIDLSPLWCPKCHYSLVGLEHAGRCPECGEPYSKRDLLRGMQR